MKKKIIVILGLLFLGINPTFALNTDEIVNEYVSFTTTGTESFIIPTGYDLKVEFLSFDHGSRTPPLNIPALIEFTDSGSLIYSRSFDEGYFEQETNLIFRDSIEITNADDHDVGVLYTGYLFKEGILLANGEELIIGENGAIKGEEEFLRQSELFAFYQAEFTALMFLTVLILLNKFSPNNMRKQKFIF